MDDLQAHTSQIIDIEGERFLISTIFKNGKQEFDYDNKLKLPIELTKNFHINRRTTIEEPVRTLKKRLISFLTLGFRL